MFFSNVKIAEKYNYLEEKFTIAYNWLKGTDLMSLEQGAYPLDNDGTVTANVQKYTTIEPQDGLFETHDKYFDIQYMVCGKEQFGICKRDGLTVKKSVPENDVVFYEEPDISGTVPLLQGDLIVVAPEDAHKPRCRAGEAEAVIKVVVKVKI
ncbi:MAG: YhcH/YjgK/YiaL family protein [Oscillospiraceae bacterium]